MRSQDTVRTRAAVGTHRAPFESTGAACAVVTNGLFVAALALTLWVWPGLAHAHLPEVFGQDYIRAEQLAEAAPANLPPREPWREAPPLADPVNPSEFDRQIREREQSGGPYAAGLTEPLSSLGLYYLRSGYYEKAQAAYQRALHVSRINDGLSSDRQIPILRELITVYRATGDYDALEGTYKHYARVRGIGRPPFDQRTVDASLEVLQWQREAYAIRPDGKENHHLLQAISVNRQILDSMNTTRDVKPDWYRKLVMNQMLNLYLLLGAEEAQLVTAGFTPGQGNADEIVKVQIARIQRTAFLRGKKLLRDLIERSQSLPPRDLAALHLELGDWYQWNDQLRKANAEYARVVDLLRSAGNEQLLDQWLGQPMELPDERTLWHTPPKKSDQDRVVVASYRVSPRGDARDIEVQADGEEDSGSARRIKKMLINTHFRPRFSQGKAEYSGQVTRRYLLLD